MSSDWVVLELGPKAEGEDPDLIRQSIRHLLRDAEVFIPAMVTQVGGDRVIQYLLEGYAFIRRDHPDDRYYRLEGSKYVQSIITHTDRSRFRPLRRIAPVPEAEVVRLRRQIEDQGNQGIGVGDTVLILSGPYRNLRAEVIEDLPEKDLVQVFVKMRSKEAILGFPRAGLRLVSKAERPTGYFAAARAEIGRWLDMALPLARWAMSDFESVLALFRMEQRVAGWLTAGQRFTALLRGAATQPNPAPVQDRWAHFRRLSGWISEVQRGLGFLRAMGSRLDDTPLRMQGQKVERLSGWVARWNQLSDFVRAFYNPPAFAPIETRYLEWVWFQDVHDRLEGMSRRLAAIELEVNSIATMQNIIIDGNNLAVRCGKAPGLDQLKDKQGQPTGVIVGFLRSLASLRKRYPDARIFVCWDGSSQRRKAIFPGYKEGRTPFDGYAQILWLRDALPEFGVVQIWNEQEEADDVIASLIHLRLSDQENIVYSTDRDLLQLVSGTTKLLYPSIAGKPEKLYDVDAVRLEYGIDPSKMVMFRAFLGDTSDKIPGIPRLREKTLTGLIRMYGSLDGIFASNLPELTKAEQGKIRASEGQVRKNVVLMTLVNDLPFTMTLDAAPNRAVAEDRLQKADVKSDALLGVFFPEESATDLS